MTDKPILILGGTGKTGSRIAARLRGRGAAARVASRSASTRFDWYDESSWEPALDGVGAVYIIHNDEAPQLVRPFAELAVEQGARRLVHLSARAWADLDDEVLLTGERAVADSGVAWTVLRPTWFSQNFAEEPFIAGAVSAGELFLAAGAGREPFIDLDDLADVAAAALTDDRHAGQTYTLSGPRALTMGEAVAEVSKATGREVRFTPVEPARYVAHLTARGFPAEAAEAVNELAMHIRDGHSDYLSDGVQRALGREPRDLASSLATGVAEGRFRY